MQDWNSSDESYRSRFLSIKFLFILMGAALWEYVRTFDYEWGVYRGRRKYLWTVWLYSGCRMLILVWLFAVFASQSGAVERHCTAMFVLTSICRYLAVSGASLIIGLRVVAIWEHKRIISVLSYSLIVACSALNMRSLFFLRAGYDPQSGSCVPFGSFNHVPCTSAVLITDLALITLMLVGLLRTQVASESSLIRYLYRQGIVWMALAVIAGVPAVVAAAVKLNAGIIMILNSFETTVLCICATRMYHGLTDYTHKPSSLNVPATLPIIHESLQGR